MKTRISILFAIVSLALPSLHAGGDHDKKEVGPNGGRVVTSVTPHYEFFVTPEKKVKITFLGEDGKAQPAKEQSVTAVGGDRAAPTKLTFVKDGDSLISDKPLPEGKELPIVVQVKVTPDAKTATEKFTVNLATCPECQLAEYACTCDHH
jgi:hypothetical protein